MTADQLAALEALCDAATPGPWERGYHHAQDHQTGAMPTKADPEGCIVIGPEQCEVADCDFSDRPSANAAFIAAARTALPELVAEVRRLRGTLGALPHNAHPGDPDAWNACMEQLGKLHATVARLRAALERYGQHEPRCDYNRIATVDSGDPHLWPCNCGLDSALRGGEP